jgi:hypothetical protein
MPIVVEKQGKVALMDPQSKPRLLVLVALLAFAVAAASATLAIFAAKAQATPTTSEASFDSHPPKTVLMKGPEVLQRPQSFEGGEWFYYKDGQWQGSVSDNFGQHFFRKAAFLQKGARVHVRIFKPERPNIQVNSHTRKGENGLLVGPHRLLGHTLKRVERNGKIVAWDVFFRVGQSKHNYYVVLHASWKRVPGTHKSYGHTSYPFHIKTR